MPTYDLKPQAHTPIWWVWKDGEKHRDFTSRPAAEAWLAVQKQIERDPSIGGAEARKIHLLLK